MNTISTQFADKMSLFFNSLHKDNIPDFSAIKISLSLIIETVHSRRMEMFIKPSVPFFFLKLI